MGSTTGRNRELVKTLKKINENIDCVRTQNRKSPKQENLGIGIVCWTQGTQLEEKE